MKEIKRRVLSRERTLMALLRTELAELDHLYQTAPVGLCLVDRDLRFIRINRRLAAINGRPVADHIGRTLRDVIPEIADTLEPVYRRVIETGEPVLDFEVQGTTPRWGGTGLVSYHPLKSDDGTVYGVSTVVQDITDRKRAEEALRQAHDQLERRVQQRTKELEEANAALKAEIAERKQADEALRQSKERYRTLIETIPHGIEEIDASGIITIANAAHHRQYEYGEGELIGMSILDLVATDSEREELRNYLRYLVKEQPVPVPYFGKKRTKKGRVIDVQVAWEYKRDTQGQVTGFTSVITDITERRRAERTLHETSQSLQAIIETSPLPIIAMDPEGKVTMWNPAAERVFGWREGEVLGHPLPFVPEDKQEEHRMLRERVVRGEMLAGMEVRRQKKDGSSIDINFSTSLLRNPEGQVKGIMGVMIDITERKQAEEALRRAHDELELRVQERTDALHESREHFRRLVETSNAIPWEANAKTWEFTYVGPQAIKLLGYPPEKWYEKDFWTSHIHPDDREYAIDLCEKSSRRYKDYEFEYRMVAADGRIVWIHDIVSVVSVNGEPETLRGFMFDISERKRVDETLRSVVEGTALVTGDDFFRSLVCNLAAALRVRYAFVSEFIDGNTRVRTLAFWTSDRFVDNVEYPIADTPCEQVLEGEMCHYPSGVQAVYPKDEGLVKLGAESYLAIPLIDRLGDVVGHLAVIDDKPMPAEIRDLAVLKIFAARAGGELVRKRVEEALRESEEGTRLVVDSALDAVITIDPGGLITGWNPQAETIFGWSREEAIGQQLAETIIPPQYREAHRRGLQHFIATGEGPILNERIEITALRRDGHEFPVELTVSPIRSGKTFNFSAFVRDISQRKRAEEALREREAALRNSQRDLRILAGKLLSAQEEERRRLARELHDDLTQRLAVLAIEAASLEKTLSSSPSTVRDRLRRIKEQMMKLSADVHGISRQLHPSILDDLGLVSAIESECAAFSERDGVRVTFIPDHVPAALPKDVSLCLYRVTQESLRNIAKHAQAKEAYVTLACLDDGVLLTIQDCGVGFDLAQAKGKAGLGLASMEERVRLLQGSLSIHSKPGQGTIIEVHAPLACAVPTSSAQ